MTRGAIMSAMARLRGLHRPVARHGDGGRPAPLPTAPNADRRAAAKHQQRSCSTALLLYGDARPTGPVAPAYYRALSAPAAGGAERRGSDAVAAGSTGAEVSVGAW